MHSLQIILSLAAAAFAGGAMLGGLRWLAAKKDGGDSRLIEELDAALPQLQCGECGYPGCRPYAEAVAREDAPINLCPPGGGDVARALASIVNGGNPADAKSASGVGGGDSRRRLRGLRAVSSGVSHRRHHRRAAKASCGHRRALRRMQVVPAALPRRLHRHGRRRLAALLIRRRQSAVLRYAQSWAYLFQR